MSTCVSYIVSFTHLKTWLYRPSWKISCWKWNGTKQRNKRWYWKSVNETERQQHFILMKTHTHTYRGSGPNATISIGNIVNDDYNVLFTLCACYFVISSINKPINIQVLYSICRWQLVFSSLIRRCRESHQHWDPFLAALIKLYIYTIFFSLLSSFLSFCFCWKIYTKYSKYTQICSQQFAISHTSISMICFIRKLRIK